MRPQVLQPRARPEVRTSDHRDHTARLWQLVSERKQSAPYPETIAIQLCSSRCQDSLREGCLLGTEPFSGRNTHGHYVVQPNDDPAMQRAPLELAHLPASHLYWPFCEHAQEQAAEFAHRKYHNHRPYSNDCRSQDHHMSPTTAHLQITHHHQLKSMRLLFLRVVLLLDKSLSAWTSGCWFPPARVVSPLKAHQPRQRAQHQALVEALLVRKPKRRYQ
mmetsp:Transcript_98219/g.219260  ORF Transcript_98219/g.219260 Transcript_98219/m.219260 type:complete len:218 (-) Transcript_98219:1011-1664(-)